MFSWLKPKNAYLDSIAATLLLMDGLVPICANGPARAEQIDRTASSFSDILLRRVSDPGVPISILGSQIFEFRSASPLPTSRYFGMQCTYVAMHRLLVDKHKMKLYRLPERENAWSENEAIEDRDMQNAIAGFGADNAYDPELIALYEKGVYVVRRDNDLGVRELGARARLHECRSIICLALGVAMKMVQIDPATADFPTRIAFNVAFCAAANHLSRLGGVSNEFLSLLGPIVLWQTEAGADGLAGR